MADPYIPDLSLLNVMGHVAPTPDGMPTAPATALPRDPMIAGMLQQVGQDVAGTGTVDPSTNKLYNYAILASLLGSAGAGLGQAFRPWVRPPQPLPSPQAPQMPITAPAALQALTQTRAARKGF